MVHHPYDVIIYQVLKLEQDWLVYGIHLVA
jgi:hypothetical protein